MIATKEPRRARLLIVVDDIAAMSSERLRGRIFLGPVFAWRAAGTFILGLCAVQVPIDSARLRRLFEIPACLRLDIPCELLADVGADNSGTPGEFASQKTLRHFILHCKFRSKHSSTHAAARLYILKPPPLYGDV